MASYLIRSGNAALRSRLRAFPLALVSVSAITEAELLYGLARRPDASSLRIAVEGFLRHVDIRPLGQRGGRRLRHVARRA